MVHHILELSNLFQKIMSIIRQMGFMASTTSLLHILVVILAIVEVGAAAKYDHSSSSEETNDDLHARRELIMLGISGFMGIDCGMAKGSHYVDDSTSYRYTSDEKYVNSGENFEVPKDFISESVWRQLRNVRSFPQGNNNCYTLPQQARGNKYLIRAIFMYGNYDSKNQTPEFELYVDVNKWDDVKLDNASDIVIKEIIHIPTTDYIHVCLVNIGNGTPFISALELIPLNRTIYQAKSGSLVLFRRLDVGAPESNQKFTRYKDDFYGRIWEPFSFPDWQRIPAPYISERFAENEFRPSRKVMTTAAKPAKGRSLEFSHRADPNQQFYLYMHFLEVEDLQPNYTRKFNIFLNNKLWFDGLIPSARPYTAYSTNSVGGDSLRFKFEATDDSTLPPTLNALEYYYVVNEYAQPPSAQSDVDAIIDIKETYDIKKNWQGDPCMPEEFRWDGLECSSNDQNGSRIISLNLSSSGLTKKIIGSFSGLSSLQSLDLSNNSLTGEIPDFFSDMQSLKIINLSGNKLTGSVPPPLNKRLKDGSLSVDRNPDLCISASCNKKHKIKPAIVELIAALSFLLLLVLMATIWKFTRKRKESIAETRRERSLESKSQTLEMIAESSQERSLRSNTQTPEMIGESIQERSLSSKTQMSEMIADSSHKRSLRSKPQTPEMIADSNQERYLRSKTQPLEMIADSSQERYLRSKTQPLEMIARSSQESSFRSKSRKFTYPQIISITNNFEKIVGRGGSATVYLGYLRDSKVAVKVFSQSSVQRSQNEFETEVELLMRIHHKNLVSLTGYCSEGTNMVIICEYMPEGNLKEHLSEKSEKILSWKERVQIALNAAQGLEYLHKGCKPSVIHRDMKTANILLDENLHAKIADFGISRILATDSKTHVTTTDIAGTIGYLDPEYHATSRLNEKSDVYSFGIILLELLTGQPAIIKNDSENIHITHWVSSRLAQGDIHEIMDPRLDGEFEVLSAWKVYEAAWACIPSTAVQRMTMTDVLTELKESLDIVKAHGRIGKTGKKDKKPNLALEGDRDSQKLEGDLISKMTRHNGDLYSEMTFRSG